MAAASGEPLYPVQVIRAAQFPLGFDELFPAPNPLVSSPPEQVTYLRSYLTRLGCKSVIIEDHYIDRDYISDLALYYSRSLRDYPNFTKRAHFFSREVTLDAWKELVIAAHRGGYDAAQSRLQADYLGFAVIRPLVGSPLGRTVLPYPPETVTASGYRRTFPATRPYSVHLAGFTLQISGLAFQQQDQGVSACATTALWSSVHCVAHREGFQTPTPAEITMAASRYLLHSGRTLPSEGLHVLQVCEAVRTFGLAPLIISGGDPSHDKAQLRGYIRSGFAPLLVLEDANTHEGHAVCAVGLKLDKILPRTSTDIHHRDAATETIGIYIHDDRLGPYAVAMLENYTSPNSGLRTALRIKWPTEGVEDTKQWILSSLLVPVPVKLRLTLAQTRLFGSGIADAVSRTCEEVRDRVILDVRYSLAHEYQRGAHALPLSAKGAYGLACETTFSRYVAVIELSTDEGPFLDVLLDTTETTPSTLAMVQRSAVLKQLEPRLSKVAAFLGAPYLA